jgi:hypothetical protein
MVLKNSFTSDPSLNHPKIMRNFKESLMTNNKLQSLNISSKFHKLTQGFYFQSVLIFY